MKLRVVESITEKGKICATSVTMPRRTLKTYGYCVKKRTKKKTLKKKHQKKHKISTKISQEKLNKIDLQKSVLGD